MSDTLRQHGRFTERARMANDASDFSRQIRRGVPGWVSPTDTSHNDEGRD